jgi:hypothetical protein
MALRFAAIVALVWVGVVLVRRLGNPRVERDSLVRRLLTGLLLSLVLVVPAILLARFALRSGNAALVLIALFITLVLTVALAWRVGRGLVGGRRHRRPPQD